MANIVVMYSCKECGALNEKVEVPARESPNSDVVHYVKEIIGRAVSEAHSRRHLFCKGKTCDLMIPMPPEGSNRDWIGAPCE